ncbi:MAG: pilus assembly protein [Ktedonobacterales bacterium]|nr:pilus assembly protein [Ktedonobacterales bacterium]
MMRDSHNNVPRGTCRARRGQALVEFALVMPLFLTLMFGLAELSLISAASALMHSTVQQGARLEAMAANRLSGIDAQAVALMLHQASTLFVVQVQSIRIYASDANGAPPQPTAENDFDGTGALGAIQTWAVATRSGTVAAPIYLGVEITYRYQWITSFIAAAGTNLVLHATAVLPIAPMGG